MKLLRGVVIVMAVAFFASAAYQANATNYGDATGDTFFGGIMDITSVEVNNDATDIQFTINLSASIANPDDWGNYMVGIDSVGGGDTTGNAWTRPISMSSGMDYWLGSWVNSGGGVQLWNYTGSWNMTWQHAVDSIGASNVTFSAPLVDLGLSAGNVICFDVYSSGTGGGDSAVDALANPNMSIADWPGPYDSGNLMYYYTVIPEPSTLVLVGLGGLALVGRMLRRRA